MARGDLCSNKIPNPLFSSVQDHVTHFAVDILSKFDSTRRNLLSNASNIFRPLSLSLSLSPPSLHSSPPGPLFASASQSRGEWGKHTFDVALGEDYISKTLVGTSVYTVANMNNEFVLISDPNDDNLKSLGLLYFRQEDARTLLAQVQSKKKNSGVGRGARVVPISLDQVYMLKVEGIAFRFLPDPLQIKNALELKSSSGFDGVPIFQSEHLVVNKKNRRYCPVYFQKEDIDRDLKRMPRKSRGSASQTITVGSLEDILKKMEMNDLDSGWDDLIFIPPGRSSSEHLATVDA
ncbi:Tic22-like family protein [Zostera marina]|uniref:Protein TIC 22, chloroplastic n=1 Tax=Zostera marina TaxID=29655 RepID=A0A0K9NS98_ZOSMR|nr:Tic22-like family protein [Zostera marina]